MTSDPDVLRIIEVLDFRANPERLKKKRLRNWFESSEPNVIGAALEAVLRHWDFIEPALTRRELGELLKKNFEVSLRSRGEKLSDYAYNCHEAAKEFYGWVIASHSALPDGEAEECLSAAKEFLEQKYRAGDEGQRNCIIAGALEHIFEVEELREVFDDWKDDPELSYAYAKAEEWSLWVAARMRTVQPVVVRTADTFRTRGYNDVVIKRPTVGTIMPVIAWRSEEENELAISCDEAWADAVESNAIDIKRAADFAADPENWVHSQYAPTHFTVELSTQAFLRSRH